METAYMIDAIELKRLMRYYRVQPRDLGAALDGARSLVYQWLDGNGAIPQYASLMIQAVNRKLPPATDETMRSTDLVGALGIGPEQARYWTETGQFPIAARLAVAQFQASKSDAEPLTSNEKKLLTQIHMAERYFRVRNGWRPRPMAGKYLPQIKLDTPNKYKRLGLLHETTDRHGNRCIELTPLGRSRILKKG